jgi:opacity protein-like surface antigen
LKGHLLASVAVVAMAVMTPALAADLPLKALPQVAAPWSWSGFYAGAHGGCAWGHDATTSANDPFFFGKFPSFSIPGFDPKGCLGGLQAGANWQTGRIVSGLEIDWSVTDIKASASRVSPTIDQGFATTSGTAATSGHFDWLGSARARLGYLATPDILLYGTGGPAWSRYTRSTDLVDTDLFTPAVGGGFANQFSSQAVANWRFGWVAGAGAEFRLFNSNWLGRVEYLHYDFGNSGSVSSSAGFGVTPTPSLATSGALTLDVVRAGVSYKFDPDRYALGWTGAAASATPALSYKATAPIAVAWTWSGFYLGAHAGYGWSRDPFTNRTTSNGVPLSGVDAQGYVGGFQAGANWQSGSVVGGLEIDLSGTGIKGSTTNTTGGGATQATQSEKFDPLGSARARVGYLVTSDVLLYGTGGLGWSRQATTTTTPGGTPANVVTPNWLFGWVAGAGVEARLGNTNWLARVEYLHYDFGDSGSSATANPLGVVVATSVVSSSHMTSDVVRAALSYKLDWPGMPGGVYRSSPYNAMAAIPPTPAAYWSWSGFYLGAHGGYGWGGDPSAIQIPFPDILENNLVPPTTVSGPHSNGYVGGFQAGGNWQSDRYVGGLEVDLSSTGIQGRASGSGIDTDGNALSGTRTDKFDLLGSARARLGYLVTPDVLLYGTGGLAWTRLEQTMTSLNSAAMTFAATPSWRFGWVAGAGGEMRLWNSNWLARLEYLHYDFGNSGATLTGFNSTEFGLEVDSLMTSRHLTADVVRAGIGYKFN